MEKVHKNITVFGDVQGVGFRFNTKKIAILLNISGYVKNLPDGNVYIEAEALPENMEEFIRWCHHGPSVSNVKSLKVSNGNILGYENFEIRF
ncbi:MAG: acylphosphatase [Bacteroidales bacterium]|nr:acylphosphatase [Bacteroidales bacterium]